MPREVVTIARVRPVVVPLGALAAVASAAGVAQAHGFGQRYDLPVPLSLWVGGAAVAVALSFVVIALFIRGTPGLRSYPRVNLLRWPIGRALAHPSVILGIRGLSVALLVLIITVGIAGSQNPTRNPAPAIVWVLWWVGFAYISSLVGNLWEVVNPWAAVFRWGEALSHRLDPEVTPARALPYLRGLGVWPAVLLFLAFAWAELVFSGRAVPANVALMAIVYSLITWTGMLVFGRATWLRRGDPFTRAFGVLARFSPTEVRVTDATVCRSCPLDCRDRDGDCVDCYECFTRAPRLAREWNLRPFAVGLIRNAPQSSSMTAFVILLLATVTFDGFTATPAWEVLANALYSVLPELGGARMTIITTLGLLVFPALFLVIYDGFSQWIASAAGRHRSAATIGRAFVLSLVPIAIGYHLAHYFTYLVIQSQLIIPIASDPFGRGWDLLGTATYRPDIGVVGARFAWYTAVISIVAGHIAAVWVAHVTALREFGSPALALRSQYPMLALMVGYTMVSLWIIAQPIVETGAGAPG